MKTIPSLALSSAFLALLGTSAHAAITYVDAVGGSTGNTFATSATPDPSDTTWFTSGTSDGNTKWGQRAFANTPTTPTVFEARDDGSGDGGVPLTTELTGLADGSYTIWAFYWVNGSQNWDILAGLSSGNLAKFDENGATGATVGTDTSTLTFSNSPMTSEGDPAVRFMYGANLGTATVSGGSVVQIFIDADGNSTSNGGFERTWYDGVGYEVVPEPSAALLGGLGALLLLRRRR